MFSEPGTARQEAEKLVAAMLAAASTAASAHPDLATGSAECCVCPLCKVIAVLRDPEPETVERLAAGAGDLAAGVASFLRHIAAPSAADAAWQTATADTGTDTAGARPADTAAGQTASAARLAAPRRPATVPPAATAAQAVPPPQKRVVKKAVKKAVPKKAG